MAHAQGCFTVNAFISSAYKVADKLPTCSFLLPKMPRMSVSWPATVFALVVPAEVPIKHPIDNFRLVLRDALCQRRTGAFKGQPPPSDKASKLGDVCKARRARKVLVLIHYAVP